MINVAHIDEYFNWTDQKLKYEQSIAMQKIKFLIEHSTGKEEKDLEYAIEQCQIYTETLKKRYANIQAQADLQQLDLFS